MENESLNSHDCVNHPFLSRGVTATSVLVNYKAEAQLCALMLLQISKAHPCTSKLFVHVVQGDRQMSKKNPLTHNLVI